MTRAPDLLLAAAIAAAQRTRPAPPPETAHRPPLPRALGPRRTCGRPCRNGAPCDITVLNVATCWRHR